MGVECALTRTVMGAVVGGGHTVGTHTVRVTHEGCKRVIQLVPTVLPQAVSLGVDGACYIGEKVRRLSSSSFSMDHSIESPPASVEEEPSGRDPCPICNDSVWSTVYVGCGHVLCEACGDKIGDRCPFCREASRRQRI